MSNPTQQCPHCGNWVEGKKVKSYTNKVTRQGAKTAVHMATSAGGMATGAAVGSAILPGIGTVVGGALGFIGSAMFNQKVNENIDKAGDAIEDNFMDMEYKFVCPKCGHEWSSLDESANEEEIHDSINEKFSFTIQRRYIANDGNLHLIGKVDSGIIEVGDYIVPLDSDGVGHGWRLITALRINNSLVKSLIKGQQGDIVINAENADVIENCSTIINLEEDGGQSHFRFEFSDFCDAVDNFTEMLADYEMLEAHDDDLSRFIEYDFVTDSVRNEIYFLDSLYALYFIKTYNDGFGDITIDQVKNAAKIAMSKTELIDYNEDEEYNLAKTLARIVYYKYVVANDSKKRMEINAIPSSFDDMSNAILSPFFWQSLCSSIVNEGQSNRSGDSFENNEQEYIDEIRDCLSDGEIGPRERRLLEKISEKLGISHERAVELEATLLLTQLTDEEQEYLTEFKVCVVDGMVSAKERRLLEKMRIMLGITEQRAKELESNYCKK